METKDYSDFTELSHDFFVFKGKLLYASEHFIGYNPRVSRGFMHPDIKYGENQHSIERFRMHWSPFVVELSSHKEGGPLRGFRRFEISKGRKNIIRKEAGSLGFGSNYFKGRNYCIDGPDAFLLEGGSFAYDHKTKTQFPGFDSDKSYLLWFKNVTIPKIHKTGNKNKKTEIPLKEVCLEEETEPQIRIDWEATTRIKNVSFHIVKSSADHFSRESSNCDNTTYKRSFFYSDFEKIEFLPIPPMEFRQNLRNYWL
jgi:hypothetical protein